MGNQEPKTPTKSQFPPAVPLFRLWQLDCSPQSAWAFGVACTFVNSLLRSLGYLVKVIQWDQSNRGQAAIVWA